MPFFGKNKSAKGDASAKAAYPQQNQMNDAPPAYSEKPPQNPQQQPPMYANNVPGPSAYPGQTTVVVKDGFDAGARFNSGAVKNIPPPPPGCAPNAAQMAAAHGHNVVVTQKKQTFMEGTGDAGYVIW